MNIREFYNRVNNCREDIIAKFLNILKEQDIPYAVIGGVAVNAYCKPVLTEDFDCVVALEKLQNLRQMVKEAGFKVKKHPYTLEIKSALSDIRIQIQLDNFYQSFIKYAKLRNVLGYKMKVATKEDVLMSKIRAYKEPTRKISKRIKDLADIRRLIEKYPNLEKLVPEDVKKDYMLK